MTSKLTLFSNRVCLPNGIQAASILINNGKIEDILPHKVNLEGYPMQDVGNSLITPGIIDAHVHINEPGRTDWEGFDTATKAAAAGGITTLVDMPLNSSPVTISPYSFEQKLAAAKNNLHVNCGFWGGLVPDNSMHIEALLETGVLGIKAFLTHSGIDEFPNVKKIDLEKAMPIIAKYGLPLLAHCELDQPHDDSYLLTQQPTNYLAYLQSRPRFWENDAIDMMIDLCRQTNCRTHIVHLSSSDAIPSIRSARQDGIPLSVETCPQYLYFNSEDIPNGDTRFKCAPPIREKANNDLLWKAIEEGLIDFIATDHSPAPPHLKEIQSGNFQKAWGGISSLQFLLPVFWTAAKKRSISLENIVNLLASSVATFIGLENRKGKIQKGFDADLVVWNPKQSFEVQKKDILHRHKITPYEGEQLFGVVEQTYVNGVKVFDNGQFHQLHQGEIILNAHS